MTGKALSWTKSSCQISDIFDDALSLTEVSCCGSGNNYAYCFTQTKDSPSTKRAGGSHSIEGLILAKTSKISQKFHSWKLKFFSNQVRGTKDQKMTKMILRSGSSPHVRPLITRWKLNSLDMKCVFLYIISIKVSPFRIGKRNCKSTYIVKYAKSWSFLLW